MFPSWSAAISFVRTGVFSFHRGHNVISVARIGVFIFPSWSQRDLSFVPVRMGVIFLSWLTMATPFARIHGGA